MNLAEAKRGYQAAVIECEAALAVGHSAEDCRAAALTLIERTRKSAMRAIDEYTSRRFVSINTRRGLVAKLEYLHNTALADLNALIGQSRDPRA